MKTSVGSAHRHKTKTKAWSDLTDADSGSRHTHDVNLSALEARITALEAAIAARLPGFQAAAFQADG